MRKKLVVFALVLIGVIYYKYLWISKAELINQLDEGMLTSDYEALKTIVSIDERDIVVSKDSLEPLTKLYQSNASFREAFLSSLKDGQQKTPIFEVTSGLRGYRLLIKAVEVEFKSNYASFDGIVFTASGNKKFSESQSVLLLPGIYTFSANSKTPDNLVLSDSSTMTVDGVTLSHTLNFETWTLEIDQLDDAYGTPVFYVNDMKVTPKMNAKNAYVIESLPKSAMVELICHSTDGHFYQGFWRSEAQEANKVVTDPLLIEMDITSHSRVNQYWEIIESSSSYSTTNFTYLPTHLNDWDQTIPWLFEVNASDVRKAPHFVIFKNETPITFHDLCIVNGYAQNEKLLNAYSTVKKVRITLSDGSIYVRDLEDHSEPQMLFFNEVHKVTWCKIEMLEFYNHDNENVVAMTEVQFLQSSND